MTEYFDLAVSQVNSAEMAFCRFITANDVNLTSHQCGFYVPKEAQELLFEEPGERGSNKEKFVKIRWQDDFETDSRFIYYGTGTRNEYRITRFGHGFPFLTEEYVGSLLIICKMGSTDYSGIVLEHDEDIDEFFSLYNLPTDKTNHLINKNVLASPDERLDSLFRQVVEMSEYFPDTVMMSKLARDLFNGNFAISDADVNQEPDKILLKWIDTEYKLFHYFEERFYQPVYSTPFKDCQSLIDFSNEILNRRKSRAGKSLEHHLSRIFTTAQLRFDEQKVTEGNKKPDFIFPGIVEYHDFLFPADELVFLGAKTTCKDRWRQVLTEADRIETKYLFTLQQGVSSAQLREMKQSNLVLVVPAANKTCFDPAFKSDLFSLGEFINLVKIKQHIA